MSNLKLISTWSGKKQTACYVLISRLDMFTMSAMSWTKEVFCQQVKCPPFPSEKYRSHSVQIVAALCKGPQGRRSQRKTHIWCRRLRGSSGDKWVWESASPKTSHPKDIFQCKVFFFLESLPVSPEIVFAVAAGPIGHPGAVGVPKKAVFMTPNWLFTGKSVILIFEILSVDFWAVWNVWTAAKISLSWESLKQSRHFYSCHIHAKLECLFTWWFAFRRYCTSFGGNSQRYKLRILWSLSKTFNRRISNDRRYTEHW